MKLMREALSRLVEDKKPKPTPVIIYDKDEGWLYNDGLERYVTQEEIDSWVAQGLLECVIYLPYNHREPLTFREAV